MKIRHTLAIAVVSCASLATIWLGREERHLRSSQLSPTAARGADARELRRAWVAAFSQVAPQLPTRVPYEHTVAAEPNSDDEDLAPLPEPSQPLAAHGPAELQRTLDDYFFRQDDEAVDPDVLQAADTQIGSLLEASSRLVSVECRGPLCRVETMHTDSASHMEFSYRMAASTEGQWDGRILMTHAEMPADGRVRSVAFLVERGEDLEAALAADE